MTTNTSPVQSDTRNYTVWGYVLWEDSTYSAIGVTPGGFNGNIPIQSAYPRQSIETDRIAIEAIEKVARPTRPYMGITYIVPANIWYAD